MLKPTAMRTEPDASERFAEQIEQGYATCDTRIANLEQRMAISIRLPNDIEARLSRLAAKTGRTKTFYVTEAIQEQLNDLEDRYLAEKRLTDSKAGKSKSYSLDEVEREIGLEH